MLTNSLVTEQLQILANLPPVSTTTARTSTPVLLDKFARGVVLVEVGDCSASSTVTLLKCADTNAASSSAIATAQLGDTGSVGDNKILMMNILPEDMFDTARPYFAVTIAAGAAQAGAKVMGAGMKYSSNAAIAAVTVVR